MRWLCSDAKGSSEDRIIETPLADEAAEDYVEAIHDDDPSDMKSREVTVRELGEDDVPRGEPRSFTVYVETTLTYSAHEG